MRIQDTPSRLSIREAIALAAAQVMRAFHREHTVDDPTYGHSTIRANGSIYERSRPVAIGDSIAPFFVPSHYTGNAAMTWTVAAAGWFYALVGGKMVADINATGTVAGVASTTLQITLPTGFFPASTVYNPCWISDNGTVAAGLMFVTAFSPLNANCISIQRQDGAAWTAGTAIVRGQLSFPIRLTS